MIINAGATIPSSMSVQQHTSSARPPSQILKVLQKCNSFIMQGLVSEHGQCQPLYACGKQIGLLSPNVAQMLMKYCNVFTFTDSAVYLNPELDTFKSRTDAVDAVLRDLREQNIFKALMGWRGEFFNVWSSFDEEPLFQIERSAVTVLGIRAFGVHINGYTRRSDGSLAVWVQKRAANKPTYPGMLDSMVGGGITAGLKPSQVLIKEAAEEASIPEDLARTARAAGAVSFFCESERGLHANNEFIYDLEIPEHFEPKNSDGEVEGFELISFPDFLGRVLSSKYKLTSVPIAVDFMIRHGIINSDNEPNLPAVQELLHIPLHQLYSQWPQT